jgi:glutathione S-transferase
MRTLLHMPFDPACRFARLMLAEKGLVVRLVETAPWAQGGELSQVNPAMTVPVLVDEPPTGGEIAVSPAAAIAEYLDEAYREPALLPSTSAARAETRRMLHWFDLKFEAEVNALIVRRRIEGRLQGRRWGEPEPLRAAHDAIAWHLDYLNFLFERRAFIAGDRFTVADLAGAAHLSVNDYFGLVPWSDFPDVRAWYQKIKSRPSMRPLLADRIDGTPAAAHYADLDF